jgi:hypothetical protein
LGTVRPSPACRMRRPNAQIIGPHRHCVDHAAASGCRSRIGQKHALRNKLLCSPAVADALIELVTVAPLLLSAHARGRTAALDHLGELRELLLPCGHNVVLSADRWPDDVRLSDIEPRFVCGGCGNRGFEVRPDSAAASRSNLRPRTPVRGTNAKRRTWRFC